VSKKTLIITDGSKAVQSIALLIKNALTDYNATVKISSQKLAVRICSAENFEGTDLLPADIFFIGCETRSPKSFAYLEEMLSHINLASRKCGIFSTEEKNLNYLKSILKDCEVYTGTPLLFEHCKINNSETKNSAVNDWVKTLLNCDLKTKN